MFEFRVKVPEVFRLPGALTPSLSDRIGCLPPADY